MLGPSVAVRSAAKAPTVAAPDSPETMPAEASRRMPCSAMSSPPAANQSKPADTNGHATGLASPQLRPAMTDR